MLRFGASFLFSIASIAFFCSPSDAKSATDEQKYVLEALVFTVFGGVEEGAVGYGLWQCQHSKLNGAYVFTCSSSAKIKNHAVCGEISLLQNLSIDSNFGPTCLYQFHWSREIVNEGTCNNSKIERFEALSFADVTDYSVDFSKGGDSFNFRFLGKPGINTNDLKTSYFPQRYSDRPTARNTITKDGMSARISKAVEHLKSNACPAHAKPF
jgi:hypothetical protein